MAPAPPGLFAQGLVGSAYLSLQGYVDSWALETAVYVLNWDLWVEWTQIT